MAEVGTPGLGSSVDLLRSGKVGRRDLIVLSCSVSPGIVLRKDSGSGGVDAGGAGGGVETL